ncbi:DUF4249 domain-containing protein [Mucilaginibacter aquaedulcis]|uniref:DUF4249 domain-containing protein n=1 Tax=Mucilaginibacter aquaedulcis TaxID=1187081 RepID=UPI0025B2C9A8|nr:DUF4249 domain-containing protein [Mucilaginibacter aquaedulcis]MDN3550520.1 DUF4249 domain-containing protein [Mucilaginibacter aquaedulcis]
MMKINNIGYLLVVMIIISSCKKPYNPPVVSSDNHYLVVEGVINSGNDSTMVSLSRTVKLSEGVGTQAVSNFSVIVEDAQGNNYTLKSEGNGKYDIGPMNLDPSKKYRLHLKDPAGKEYASDYVEVRQNPSIDSIGFSPKNGDLQLYVNTHNSTNNTRYYRWDYSEAWKFQSKYQSNFIVDAPTKSIRPRREGEDIHVCFGSDNSSNIILASSEKLAEDIISQGPITTIQSTSEKIGIRYTILLKQYALTKDGYQFWESLRKNTEQLGSIFDAQPTQLQGNIHNLKDPAEPVIGYISVTNVQSKRVYINKSQLPKDWNLEYPYDCGTLDSAYFHNPLSGLNEVLGQLINGTGVPVNAFGNSSIEGYLYSSPSCVDCTIRGRTKQPTFWTDK